MLQTANALTTGTISQLSTNNNSVNSTNGLLFVANNGTSLNGVVFGVNNSNIGSASGFWVRANGMVAVGTKTPSSLFQVAGGLSTTNNTTVGVGLTVPAQTFTDSNGTGTVTHNAINALGIPTLVASGAVTYTGASTLYIDGPPVASTNVTLTTPYSLYTATGLVNHSFTTATTNAAQNVLLLANSLTTGTVATNFGTALKFQATANNSGSPSVLRDSASIQTYWSNATDSIRTSKLGFSTVNNAGSLTELAYFGTGGTSTGELTIGTSNSVVINRAGLTTATAYTVGGSSSALTLGGSSGTVTASSSAASNGSISLTTSGSGGNVDIINSVNGNGLNLLRLGRGQTYTGTSGNLQNVRVDGSFSPTSGSMKFSGFLFAPTINQTSTASGISVGFELGATATSAVDYRAIEVNSTHTWTSGSQALRLMNLSPTISATSTASPTIIGIDLNPTLTLSGSGNPVFKGINIAYSSASSYGIYQSGTATLNTFAGKNGFGATTTPTDVLEVTGNIALLTAGNKLKIATGSNASVGTATLTAGTVTVSTTAVTSSSIIFLSLNTAGGTLGIQYGAPVASIVNGTSFVINSESSAGAVVVTDISTVN